MSKLNNEEIAEETYRQIQARCIEDYRGIAIAGHYTIDINIQYIELIKDDNEYYFALNGKIYTKAELDKAIVFWNNAEYKIGDKPS
jgi:hypothetical protein